MKSQAQLLKRDYIINIIHELSTLEASLKWASQPRIMLEVALIKICNINSGSHSRSDLNLGLNSRSGSATDLGTDSKLSSTPDSELDSKRQEISDITKLSDSTTDNAVNNAEGNQFMDSYKKLDETWKDVLHELSDYGKRPLCICLNKARIVPLNKNSIGIVFPEQGRVNKEIASQTENHQLIEKAVRTVMGKDIRVRCMVENDADSPFTHELNNEFNNGQESHHEDDFTNKIIGFADKHNIPIKIIDE